MDIKLILPPLAEQYNDLQYFKEDPIIFPRHFAELYKKGLCSIKDVECAAIIAAHLAWGRRSMIVRDCTRAMEEMNWKPYDYIMKGVFKNDACSLHRTVKWCEFSDICSNIKSIYSGMDSIEELSPDEIRVKIYGQKSNKKGTNKKIHLLRRWMVRDDGKVDLGLWKKIDKNDLIIPLDVHVFSSAKSLDITSRNAPDYQAAIEITETLKEVFPGDPTLGDYALFAYAATNKGDVFNTNC
jgi:hypothetical protein